MYSLSSRGVKRQSDCCHLRTVQKHQHKAQQIPSTVPVLPVSTMMKRTEAIHWTKCHSSTTVLCIRNIEISQWCREHVTKYLLVKFEEFVNFMATNWSTQNISEECKGHSMTPVSVLHFTKLKYSQCTGVCKGHSMTAISVLHYTNWSTHNVPEGVRAIAWHH